MNKRSIFISYNRRDADLANELRRALTRSNLDVFLDHDLLPGEILETRYKTRSERSDALVLIASPYALSSSWTSYEAGMAEALGKSVMVLLPNKHSVSGTARGIRRSQYPKL